MHARLRGSFLTAARARLLSPFDAAAGEEQKFRRLTRDELFQMKMTAKVYRDDRSIGPLKTRPTGSGGRKQRRNRIFPSDLTRAGTRVSYSPSLTCY